MRLRSTVALTLPPGYRRESLPASVQRDTAHVHWSAVPLGQTLQFQLNRKFGQFPARQYSEYQQEMRSAVDAVRGMLVLTR